MSRGNVSVRPLIGSVISSRIGGLRRVGVAPWKIWRSAINSGVALTNLLSMKEGMISLTDRKSALWRCGEDDYTYCDCQYCILDLFGNSTLVSVSKDYFMGQEFE